MSKRVRLIALAMTVAALSCLFFSRPGSASSLADYRSYFDATYQQNITQLDAYAAVPYHPKEGRHYYTMQYALDATLCMYEATKDVKYLERVLKWAETMASQATITDNQGYLNWPGEWNNSPYTASSINFAEVEFQGSTELARLVGMILTDPALKATYGSRAMTIYNFLQRHMVEKWLPAPRGEQAWLLNRSNLATNPSGMNDKVVLFIRILLPIYQAGVALGQPNDNYKKLLTQVATNYRARFQPGAIPSHPSALPWDLGRFYFKQGASTYTGMDTSHGNRWPRATIDLYQAGIAFDRSYIDGLSALLTQVIWNQDPASPAFNNWIDGTNGPMDAGNYVYPPWTMGVIYTGWAALGEFDPHVQAVVDDVFVALRKGPPFNPSLGAMNTVWGKLEIAAHAAKNLARNRQLP